MPSPARCSSRTGEMPPRRASSSRFPSRPAWTSSRPAAGACWTSTPSSGAWALCFRASPIRGARSWRSPRPWVPAIFSGRSRRASRGSLQARNRWWPTCSSVPRPRVRSPSPSISRPTPRRPASCSSPPSSWAMPAALRSPTWWWKRAFPTGCPASDRIASRTVGTAPSPARETRAATPASESSGSSAPPSPRVPRAGSWFRPSSPAPRAMGS